MGKSATDQTPHRPDLIRRNPVPAEIRDAVRAEKLTAAPGWRAGGRAAVIAAIWVVLALLAHAAGSGPVTLLVVLCETVIVCGMYSALHESTHRNLFRRAGANRAAAVVAAAVLLVNSELYRAFHLHHHAYTRQENPSPEPEVIYESVPGYVMGGIVAAGSLGFLIPMQVASIGALFGRFPFYVGSARQRRAVRGAAVVQLAVVAALVLGLVLAPAWVLLIWLGPVLGFYFAGFGIVSLPEHYGLPAAANTFETTRTMRAAGVFSFFYWRNEYHAEHHLMPNVPYTGMPRLHALVGPRAVHVTGYWSFHRERLAAIRAGDPRRGLPAEVAPRG